MAGWGNVGVAPICVNSTTPCPDLMAIGTTQLAARVYEGVVEPLATYFLEWARENGQQITDDIVKYAFYDYYINGTWSALPLMSDYRLLWFNRTVFDQLNLTYPPPLGQWGDAGEPFWKEWTWKVFTDYAIRIKNHYMVNGTGFRLPTAWDEEFYIFQTMLRNYGVSFVDPATWKCGLRNPQSVSAVKNIIKKLFIDEMAVDLEGLYSNDATFTNWTKAGLLNPLDNPLLCCADATAKFGGLPGMMIFFPKIPFGNNFNITYYDTRRLSNASDIGVGLIPGRFTFLGGSGVFMTKQSKHKNLAWKLMKILINNDFGVTKVLNQEQGTVPPYESAQDNSPWNSAQYEISRLGLKRAVPLQYPATTFPQFGEIESRKPFRLLLAEMIYKNVSAEVAVERACQIIDHVFLPKCSMKHITSSLSECYQNGSMVMSFQWDENQACRDGIRLPEIQANISCTYLPLDGPQSITLMSLNGALMLYVIFTSVAFFVFRTRASIKRSGFLFSQCTIFGALLCTIAVMLGVGKPTESTCVGFTAFLSIGFVVMFGSFIAKLYRIQQIFHGSKKVAKNKKLTDAVLFRYLCGIVLVEALLLVLWAIVDVPGLTVHRSFVQNVGTVTQATCKHGSTMAAALLLYNAVLILAAAIIAFKVRNVPTDFNETKVMVFAVYSVTFIIAIVVPTTTQLTHSQSFQTLILFGCLLATSSSIIVFTAPKLLAAFRDEKGSAITQFPGYSGEKSTISKCVCPHCPKHNATGSVRANVDRISAFGTLKFLFFVWTMRMFL